MITAWRVVRHRHANQAFGGEGARRMGGRFNSRGTAVVYTADSLALALLEVMVHVPSYTQLQRRAAIPVRFPVDCIEATDAEALPADWRAHPPALSTQHLGDRWVEETRSLILKVPSVIVPHAYNYVLNPTHPDVDTLDVGAPEDLPIDDRLIMEP